MDYYWIIIITYKTINKIINMMGSLSNGKLVGLYGIQGVGKSYILKKFANERIEWHVCDGSDLIREVLKDQDQTMEYFNHNMTSIERADVRKAAIESAKKKPGVTLVAGHGSFATKEDDASLTFNNVFTSADGAAYDHIIYLEKPAGVVFDQVEKDMERSRTTLSTEQLQLWMDYEKELLEVKCLEHGIAFRVFCLDGSNDHLNLIDIITEKVVMPACEGARLKSEQALIMSIKEVPAADVYLLIDGDRTLVPQDTGTLFFDQVSTLNVPQPLKEIFQRYESYTFQAFWEVAMLYSNVLSLDEYNSLCKKIGSEQVHVHEAWNSFLNGLPNNVHPIILSSSIREVWLAMQLHHTEKHGQTSGLGRASVIAGNSLCLHSYIIDDQAKALVAKELRRLHCGCIIVGFGDSGERLSLLSCVFYNSSY
jgi:adenylate kinase